MYSKCVCKFMFLLFAVSSSAYSDVTYWFDSSALSDVRASIEEAVPIYNKYGSFNKHLSVYYNSGVPTAQANYDGVITFGGSRNTRVAMHEMGHTVGVGTYGRYGNLMVSGLWQGFYGRKLALAMDGGYADGLHGDGTHIWPWGLNYDSEDTSYAERIKHVQIMAALRCDMGILAYSKEAEHQVAPLGGTAIFGVASPLADSYQWYKDGTALNNGTRISGANRSTLQITNVTAADAGNYYCIAADTHDNLTSRTRRLSIKGKTGWWHFDNNTDDTTGAFNGTAYGSPSYTTGKIDTAIDLDGSNDYVVLPAGVADTNDMSITAWVYWDGGNNWQRIFDFGSSSSNFMFLTPSNGSVMRFAIKNGGSEQRVDTSRLATGQWVHLAVTLRDDAATLYVNGKAVSSNGNVTINPAELLADRNYIGDSQFSADPLFNGRIDEFRIFNHALSGSQIWNLWGQNANNPPKFSSNLIDLPNARTNAAYSGQTLANFAADPEGNTISFSKISGPTWLNVASNGTLSGTPGSGTGGKNTFVVRATDSLGASDDIAIDIIVSEPANTYYRFEGSVNDNNGTNHGTPIGSPTYPTGILGQAIDLDGSNDYVTLPTDVINTEDFTIAAWVKWDGGGNWQRIFDFGNNTTEYMFLSPNADSGTLTFAISGSGDKSAEQKLQATGLTAGQWTHVAVTLTGNTGRLYVNGRLKDINTAMTIDPTDFNPTVNYIGKSQWSDPLFNGQIDDFRILDYALDDSQITVLSMPPSFTTDTISNLEAIELQPYTGTPLTEYVDSPLGTDTLTFSLDAGPNWLNVSDDGSLSGIPADSHAGTNTFTVRVANQVGFDTAQMTIRVTNVYSGQRGPDDLAALAAQWLLSDCSDTPACDGADLTGDSNVNIKDFAVQAHNWLADETLQLYLKFDHPGNNTITDSSIYNHTCQPVNGPTKTTAGYLLGSMTFDGTDDYIIVDNLPGIGSSNPRTFSAWIKADEDLTNTEKNIHSIISWGKAESARKWLLMLDNQTGQLALAIYAGRLIGGPDLEDGQWHHIAAVLPDTADNLNQVKLFVDGFEISTNAGSLDAIINTALTENIIIGAMDTDSTSGIQSAVFPFSGSIDELRLYNTAFSNSEIAELANIQ